MRSTNLHFTYLLTYLHAAMMKAHTGDTKAQADMTDDWHRRGHQEAPAQENHNAPTDALCRHHTNTAIRWWQRWQRHCTGVGVGVGQHSAGITEVGDNVVGYEDTCL